MKRQLETLESRYCLSSPMHAGGDFVRHQHAEFHVASFNGGGGVTFEQTTIATGKKVLATAGKRFEAKLEMVGSGFDPFHTGGPAGNRADRASGWSNGGFHDGYIPAPPPLLLPPGFSGVIFISMDGNGAAVEPDGVTTTVSTGSSGVTRKAKAPANPALVTDTNTTIDDRTAAAAEARPASAGREMQASTARIADLFADAEPITASGPILASASSTLAARAADFAAAAMQSIATDWSDGVSFTHIAEKLVSQWLPAADMIVNAPIVSAASNVIMPVVEHIASAAMAPTAAAYEIVHLGSPFTLLADSLASFVEDSATVNNVLAQARPTKPWGLTFTVLAADLVVVSYVYRRKKLSRRVALAPIGAE